MRQIDVKIEETEIFPQFDEKTEESEAVFSRTDLLQLLLDR